MLIYHPVFDTNHGMFRMLSLLEATSSKSLRWDAFRILDLYYLFPHLLGAARLPRALSGAKPHYGKMDARYNKVPAPRVFIQQLVGLHEIVARSLIGKDFLAAGAFERNLLQRTEKILPAALIEAFQQADDRALVELLATQVGTIPLNGPNGLKDRTGLLEHRYDAV